MSIHEVPALQLKIQSNLVLKHFTYCLIVIKEESVEKYENVVWLNRTEEDGSCRLLVILAIKTVKERESHTHKVTYLSLSDLQMCAISGTKGSSGFGSQSSEHMDNKTGKTTTENSRII